ncbi:MAG: hypothetical protein P8R42_28095 [Candidatus Binatia bacterium]|nr:hypothetical protein [Candidatus Binatia bacterium]
MVTMFSPTPISSNEWTHVVVTCHEAILYFGKLERAEAEALHQSYRS